MRRSMGFVILVLGMFGSTKYAYAQDVDSSIKIDSVTATFLGAGKGYMLEAKATMTLSSKANAVVSYSFYFRDTKSNVMATNINAFTTPAPGKSVQVTFKPVALPLFVTGNYTAFGQFSDNKGANSTDSKVGSVP